MTGTAATTATNNPTTTEDNMDENNTKMHAAPRHILHVALLRLADEGTVLPLDGWVHADTFTTGAEGYPTWTFELRGSAVTVYLTAQIRDDGWVYSHRTEPTRTKPDTFAVEATIRRDADEAATAARAARARGDHAQAEWNGGVQAGLLRALHVLRGDTEASMKQRALAQVAAEMSTDEFAEAVEGAAKLAAES